jgi:hypothetical protein
LLPVEKAIHFLTYQMHGAPSEIILVVDITSIGNIDFGDVWTSRVCDCHQRSPSSTVLKIHPIEPGSDDRSDIALIGQAMQ